MTIIQNTGTQPNPKKVLLLETRIQTTMESHPNSRNPFWVARLIQTTTETQPMPKNKNTGVTSLTHTCRTKAWTCECFTCGNNVNPTNPHAVPVKVTWLFRNEWTFEWVNGMPWKVLASSECRKGVEFLDLMKRLEPMFYLQTSPFIHDVYTLHKHPLNNFSRYCRPTFSKQR